MRIVCSAIFTSVKLLNCSFTVNETVTVSPEPACVLSVLLENIVIFEAVGAILSTITNYSLVVLEIEDCPGFPFTS